MSATTPHRFRLVFGGTATIARIDLSMVQLCWTRKPTYLLLEPFCGAAICPICTPKHEGSRTTAAVAAFEFGNVLKIRGDGLISFFQKGKCVWGFLTPQNVRSDRRISCNMGQNEYEGDKGEVIVCGLQQMPRCEGRRSFV